MRRIHFTTNPGEKPTLRCRLFGHKWATASATHGGDYYASEVVEICRRCRALRDNSWEKFRSATVDGGKAARQQQRFEEHHGHHAV